MFLLNVASLLSVSASISLYANAQLPTTYVHLPICVTSVFQQSFSFSISLKKDPSLCVAGSSPRTGTPVVIEDCNTGSPFQTFIQSSALGQLQLFGLCLAPVSQVTDGAKLVLADCTDSNAQKWNPFAGDALVKNLAIPNIVSSSLVD